MGPFLTFACPTEEERYSGPAAASAWYASQVADGLIAAGDEYYLPCLSCGRATGNWCNGCEMNDIRPYPHCTTHYTHRCNTCEKKDVACSMCGLAYSEGPSDLAMTKLNHVSGSRTVVLGSFTSAEKAEYGSASNFCLFCGEADNDKKLKYCQCKERYEVYGNKRAAYCSSKCQRAHWKAHHKHVCVLKKSL